MYEDYFALRIRPFSANPKTDTFIATAAVEEALRTTLDCVLAGNGPAIVTGATGVGKTAFCAELTRRAAQRLHAVILGSTGFHNRRELWQALLFEFGHEFAGLTEHEARLRVLETARSRSLGQEAVLLIIDEAHRLEPRLLDELWQLTTQQVHGWPVIRLVLSGQLELEELLASPELGALNQHLGSHVTLESLTSEESRQFIARQLEGAGTDISHVFTADAVALICRASDGNCRAINQLCDHSLLLAFVQEEQPVTVDTVQTALDDLKGLPLHWNVTSSVECDGAPGECDYVGAGPAEFSSPLPASAVEESEITSHGSDVPDPVNGIADPVSEWDSAAVAVIEVGGDDFGAAEDVHVTERQAAVTRSREGSPHGAVDDEMREFCVEDPYAKLDQLSELGLTAESTPGIAVSRTGAAAPEERILAELHELREEIRSSRPSTAEGEPVAEPQLSYDDTAVLIEEEEVWDVIEPEYDSLPPADTPDAMWAGADLAPDEVLPRVTAEHSDAPPVTGSAAPGSTTSAAPVDSRRYARLFIRLRRRRREISETLHATIPFCDR